MPRLPFGGTAGAGAAPAAVIYEMLDAHEAAGVESTYTFTPASALSGATFSEIIIMLYLDPTAALALELQLNASVLNYHSEGFRITAGVETLLDDNALAFWNIASATLMSGASKTCVIEVRLGLPDPTLSRKRLSGFASASSEQAAWEERGLLANFTTDTITDLIWTASASSWKAGSKIMTYGVNYT